MWQIDLFIIKSSFELQPCEPYCQFKFLNQKYRTKTDHETKKPRWNQEFKLKGETNNFKEIIFKLYNDNKIGKSQLGLTQFSLRKELQKLQIKPENGAEFDKTFKLDLYQQKTVKHMRTKIIGNLKIRVIGNIPNGAEPFKMRRNEEIFGEKPQQIEKDKISFEVAVLKGKNIFLTEKESELLSLMVCVKFDKKVLFTSVQKETAFPKWNQNFHFETTMNEITPEIVLELRSSGENIHTISTSLFDLISPNFTQKTEFVIFRWFPFNKGKLRFGFRINFSETVDFSFLRQLCGLERLVRQPLFDPNRDQNIWGLRLKIDSATLSSADTAYRQMDLFCRFKFENKSFKTTAENSRGTFSWRENFMLLADYKKFQSFKIEICERNKTTKATQIGNASIKLNSFLQEYIGETRNGQRIIVFEKTAKIISHTDTRKTLGTEIGSLKMELRVEFAQSVSFNSLAQIVLPNVSMEPKFILENPMDFGIAVTVCKATGLPSADITGFSDPFCTLEFQERKPYILTPPSNIKIDGDSIKSRIKTEIQKEVQEKEQEKEKSNKKQKGNMAKLMKQRLSQTKKQLKKEIQMQKKQAKQSKKEQKTEQKKSNTFKTKVIKKTLNPTWNETFEYKGSFDTIKKMIITVFDWDRFSSNDYLGTVKINVKKLFKENFVLDQTVFWKKKKYNVQGILDTKTGVYKNAGELKLKFHLEISPSCDVNKLRKVLGIQRKELTRRIEEPETPEKWALALKFKHANNLVASDMTGYSDPFCSFRLSPEKEFRTSIQKKTLFPIWNETITHHVFPEHCKSIEITVFDWDRISSNDYLGTVKIPLFKTLKDLFQDGQYLYHSGTLELPVLGKRDPKSGTKPQQGTLFLSWRVEIPQKADLQVIKEQLSVISAHPTYKISTNTSKWAAKIDIRKARGLPSGDIGGLSDPFCQFSVAGIEFKTNIIKNTLYPVWNESFHLINQEPFNLRKIIIDVYDYDKMKKNTLLGHAKLNLGLLVKEHFRQNERIFVFRHVKIPVFPPIDKKSGKLAAHGEISVDIRLEAAQDASLFQMKQFTGIEKPPPRRKLPIVDGKVAVQLTIKKAENLKAADISGTSDPFCKFKIEEKEYKTEVVKSTLFPFWNQDFLLHPDFNEIKKLKITVWDWDRVGKNDLLGTTKLNIADDVKQAFNDQSKIYVFKKALLLFSQIDPKSGQVTNTGTLHIQLRIEFPENTTIEELKLFCGILHPRLSYQLLNDPKRKDSKPIAISLKISKGMNLPVGDDSGTSDGYCQFKIGEKEFKTKTIKNSLFPIWKETFIFHLTFEELLKSIKVNVWDWNKIGKSDFLGEAKIRISQLIKNLINQNQLIYQTKYESQIRQPIDPKTGPKPYQGKINGTIRIEFPETTEFNQLKQSCGLIPFPLRYQLPTQDNKISISLKISRGMNLPVGDISGTSDGYCQFKIGEKEFKTKTIKNSLFPIWKETFIFHLTFEELLKSIKVNVWDWNKIGKSDFLGEAKIRISKLIKNSINQNQLIYQTKYESQIRQTIDPKTGNQSYKGKINGTIRIEFPETTEFNQLQKSCGLIPFPLRYQLPTQDNKISISLKISRGMNLPVGDISGTSDGYCQFKIGEKEFKTKTIKNSLFPIWKETFIFHLTFEELLKSIKVNVWDWNKIGKSDFLGEAKIRISKLIKNSINQNQLIYQIKYESQIRQTIDPKTGNQSYKGKINGTIRIEFPETTEFNQLKQSCGLIPFPLRYQLPTQDNKISISLKVSRGMNLPVGDISGTSDGYCQFKIGEKEFKTKTIKNSLFPIWKETFIFHLTFEELLKSIKVNVWDWNKIGKSDFLGEAKIRISKLIKNSINQNQLIYQIKYESQIRQTIDPKTGNQSYKGKINGTIRIEFPETTEFNQLKQSCGLIPFPLRYQLPTQDNKISISLKISRGMNLPVGDISGTSDGYCQFKIKEKEFKTKKIKNSLFPIWKETFIFHLTFEELLKSIRVNVWDWNKVGKNDFLGEAKIRISKLIKNLINQNQLIYQTKYESQIRQPIDPKTGPKPYQGKINGTIRIEFPETTEFNQLKQSCGLIVEPLRYQLPTQDNKISISLKISRGMNLPVGDISGTSDGYCQFKIREEEFKTNTIKNSLFPIWKEIFIFHLTFEELLKSIKINVWDWNKIGKSDFLGEAKIRISKLIKNLINQNQLIYQTKYESQIRQPIDPKTGNQSYKGKINGTIRIEFPETTEFNQLQKSCGLIPFPLRYQLPTQDNKISISLKISRGMNLPVGDISGTSDGYCQFKIGEKEFKTKTIKNSLFPIWKETFIFHLTFEELLKSIRVNVWDWNKVGENDFLGEAKIRISQLIKNLINQNQLIYQIKYESQIRQPIDPKTGPKPYQGKINGTIRIEFPEITEFNQLQKSCGLIVEPLRYQLPTQDNKISISLKLSRGMNLPVGDISGTSDGYCQFKIREKEFKTKTIKNSLFPIWKETFIFHLTFEELLKSIRVNVWDWNKIGKSDLLGEAKIRISQLIKNLINQNQLIYQIKYESQIRQPIDPKTGPKPYQGKINGTIRIEFPETTEFNQLKKSCGLIVEPLRYQLPTQDNKISISLKISRGMNLPVGDISGTSDGYCQFKIREEEFKTKTIKNSLFPIWKETFIFHLTFEELLKSIRINVWDWDKVGKNDLLGEAKIRISQLIKNLINQNQLIYQIKYESQIRQTIDPKTGPKPYQGKINGTIRIEFPEITEFNQLQKSCGLIVEPLRYQLPTQDNKISISLKISRGMNLPVGDDTGTSDGYCQFKIREKEFKTKTIKNSLFPIWKETFIFHLTFEELLKSIRINVWDWNKVGENDLLGEAKIRISQLIKNLINQNQLIYQIKYESQIRQTIDPKTGPKPYQGKINGTIRIEFPEITEFNQLQKSCGLIVEPLRYQLPTQDNKISISLKISRGMNLPVGDDTGTSDGYCQFKIREKEFKTKTIKNSLFPIWKETFIFHLTFEELLKSIRINVWDWDKVGKNDLLGEAKIRISQLIKNLINQNQLIYQIKYESQIRQTIDPKTGPKPYQGKINGTIRIEFPEITEFNQLKKSCGLIVEPLRYQLPTQDNKISISLKISRGMNLPVGDISGTSDGYCQFKIGEKEFKTKTIKNSLFPIWKETFIFHLTFEELLKSIIINVWDWDKVGKNDLLGKAKIRISDVIREKIIDQFPNLKNMKMSYNMISSIEKQIEYRIWRFEKKNFPISVEDDPINGPSPNRGEIQTRIRIEFPEQIEMKDILMLSGFIDIPKKFEILPQTNLQNWGIGIKINKILGAPQKYPNILTEIYFEMLFAGGKYKSKKSKKTLYPKWKEYYQGIVEPFSEEKIRLKFYVKRSFASDILLGYSNISINDIIKEEYEKKNFITSIIEVKKLFPFAYSPRIGVDLPTKQDILSLTFRIELGNHDLNSVVRKIMYPLDMDEPHFDLDKDNYNIFGMEIKINKCRDLFRINEKKKLNSFVEVYLQEKLFAITPVIKKTRHPKWKQQIPNKIGNYEELRKLRFIIYHRKMKAILDEKESTVRVSSGKLDIFKFLRNKIKMNQRIYLLNEWIELFSGPNPKTGEYKKAGKINIKIRFEMNNQINFRIIKEMCGVNKAVWIPKTIMSDPMSHQEECFVRLYINKGKSLPSGDRSTGLSDPYCSVPLPGNTVLNTEICKNTLFPLWRSTFDFYLNPNDSKKLQIIVKDYNNIRKDQILGSILIKIWKLLNDTFNREQKVYFIKKEFDVVKKTNEKKIVGQIQGKVSMKIWIEIGSKVDYHSIAQFCGLEPRFYASEMELKQGQWGVKIYVKKATNIPVSDLNGYSDAYCVVRVGKENFKTKVCKKSLNPVWNEVFQIIDLQKELSKVYVDVYDKDRFSKDDRIGDLKINLVQLFQQYPVVQGCDVKVFRKWFDIIDKSGNPHGSILIKFYIQFK
ncbi:c2 domain-containing protein [Anaeramoeba ignava]|uniref:C2 domain-containing protein n=1 Tax=Anaeramoeba ignava TaxID=1746090 RepID=A0A9Q0L8Z1_ANAIG|nr:c2 domain-containing protein [Anaeramoeba ignava]